MYMYVINSCYTVLGVLVKVLLCTHYRNHCMRGVAKKVMEHKKKPSGIYMYMYVSRPLPECNNNH